jgi:hypothetical protein
MGCAGGLRSPIVPTCDNVVAWLGTTGILAAMPRRAVEGKQLSGHDFADESRAVAAIAWHLR